jgi:hypothetical protein
VSAFLDDYAFLVEGLLQLHGAAGNGRWLSEAVRLAEEQERRLGDSEGGGTFAAGQDEHLLFRSKPAFDGAVASGNGIAALNAVELARLTGDAAWRDRAEGALLAFAEGMTQAPLAHVPRPALERLVATPGRRRPGEARPSRPRRSAPPPRRPRGRGLRRRRDRPRQHGEDDWKPFRIEMTVRKGWHVNANPAGPGLVPTGVAGVVGRLRNLRFPASESWDGGGGTVPVYQGRFTIEGEIERQGGGAAGIEVGYQACDDARCLPPVTRIVRLR